MKIFNPAATDAGPPRWPIAVLAVSVLAGCDNKLVATTADLEIGIVWAVPQDGSSDKVCPRYTVLQGRDGEWRKNDAPAELPKLDSVQWQAYEPDGDGFTERAQRYRIYFDPFQGQPIRGNTQGRTSPQNVDSDSPLAVYKYTVVAMAGPNVPVPDCEPFDPRIRIHQ